MPIQYGSRELTDPYYLYKVDLSKTDYLEHERTPICKFNACDFVNQREKNDKLDGLNSYNNKELTIKAFIKPEIDVNVNDWVVSIKENKKWKITSVEVQDDGQMKRNSLKPRQYLILTLIGK